MKNTEQKHTETVNRVLAALEEIRPFLNKDGGDIEMVDVDGDKVTVKLLGNCVLCAMNISTMKLGVESTIKKHAPEIREVINISED